MTDYKKYALGQVENFLYDAMSTDATPQEIYDTIRGVVEDNYYTYKKSASEAYELLGLLNGNGKGHLTCDKDDTSPECKKSWSDFWTTTSYTEEEIGAMCAAAEVEQDMKNAEKFLKKDKVKKWVLPVEETKVEETDETEYFITFPDDLLEATDLVEGDQIEWQDQGDGLYILKKVENKKIYESPDKGKTVYKRDLGENERTLVGIFTSSESTRTRSYDQMIADGWDMTDDGFWVRMNNDGYLVKKDVVVLG
jgi:bifunctional DNA-binding transcriptional regulator/antitoxin component of YhaV-PrlF toxin-antitoxin module